MKNKKLIYFLVLAVIVIWGFVFKEIFGAFYSNSEDTWEQHQQVSLPKKEIQLDTFSILANYKDPFLRGNLYVEQETRLVTPRAIPRVETRIERVPPTPKIEAPKKIEMVIDWSFVQYNGFFYNQQKKKKTALLTVNGEQYMLSEGDSIPFGLKLLELKKDSLKIRYQTKEQYIKKK